MKLQLCQYCNQKKICHGGLFLTLCVFGAHSSPIKKISIEPFKSVNFSGMQVFCTKPSLASSQSLGITNRSFHL